MSAYVIAESISLDEAAYDRYRQLAGPSIAEYGGRVLVRGATPAVAEGDMPEGAKTVVIEFADMDTVHRWHESDSYAKALEFRDAAMTRRLFFVDGVPG